MRNSAVIILLAAVAASAQNIILTNDDGWAVAQIRAQNEALKASGFNVRALYPPESKEWLMC